MSKKSTRIPKKKKQARKETAYMDDGKIYFFGRQRKK
jgi:hypothetical protein